jgi:hypothetical protein
LVYRGQRIVPHIFSLPSNINLRERERERERVF